MPLAVKPNRNVPFEIRHEDPDFLVVEKPAGVVTQPGKGHERDSLLNGLFERYGNLLQNLGEARDWGLLHRLDKDTSGLVLVGLRPRAYDHLRNQFEKRLVKKTYWALIAGRPRRAQAVIQQPIAEVSGIRKRAVIRPGGAPAITAYRILQTASVMLSEAKNPRASARRASTPGVILSEAKNLPPAPSQYVCLIEASPKTGRLHQIRVHMASLGHPVLGDAEYGPRPDQPGGLHVPRLCLHAASLCFIHPVTGHRLTVCAPWPQDLRKLLSRFGLNAPEHAGRTDDDTPESE